MVIRVDCIYFYVVVSGAYGVGAHSLTSAFVLRRKTINPSVA